MRGPGPAAGAPVAVATLPSRGLPRCVQFSVAKSVQFSMARSVQFSVAIDKPCRVSSVSISWHRPPSFTCGWHRVTQAKKPSGFPPLPCTTTEIGIRHNFLAGEGPGKDLRGGRSQGELRRSHSSLLTCLDEARRVALAGSGPCNPSPR